MRPKESQEDDFYKELDGKTQKKSFCTCYTMSILFGLMALFLVVSVFAIAKRINTENILNNLNVPILSERLKHDDQIITESPTIELVVTADDINGNLSSSLKSYSLPIEHARTSISPNAILITGKISLPLKLPVEISALPIVKEDRVKVSVIHAKLGIVSMPGMMRVGFENSLNQALDKNLEIIYQKYEVTNVRLEEGQMIISGKIK